MFPTALIARTDVGLNLFELQQSDGAWAFVGVGPGSHFAP